MSNIELVEDTTSDEEIKRARALGTIEVVVRTAVFSGVKQLGFGNRYRGNRHWDVSGQDENPGYPFAEMSEKALKGRSISHSTA